MSKLSVKVTFFEKVQNERGVYVLKQCLQVWHSVILLTNMGVFIAVDENVTYGDIAITGDTIWSLFPVEQISMGEVSVADSCPKIPAEQCDYDEDSEDDSIDGDSETEKELSTENNGQKKVSEKISFSRVFSKKPSDSSFPFFTYRKRTHDDSDGNSQNCADQGLTPPKRQKKHLGLTRNKQQFCGI
ncbi:hypothetical protein HOLleu_20851 [Holothuria leucospilota]|uniref:Uncharacterized protein n=1 Tax=Holothuria leucospilota TaxID=206669 RepID=A0A9Q1BWY7_HOLLE|nr:hypothetical protein HOLleu_20851 [Holothuria leucospilota]